jgi:hypothetical protein
MNPIRGLGMEYLSRTTLQPSLCAPGEETSPLPNVLLTAMKEGLGALDG